MTVVTHDMLIVGAGPAGLACALKARQQGLSALVVDRSPLTGMRIGEHAPPSVRIQLQQLGCANLLEAEHHAGCPGVCSTWGSGDAERTEYFSNPYGHGFNLNRCRFDDDLANLAVQEGADLISNSRVVAVERQGETWSATITGHECEFVNRARFVVDATGRSAFMAKQFGARRQIFDQLVGVVGRTGPVGNTDSTVLIEAVESGWWYSAGMADGSIIACFMTDPDCADLSGGARHQTWQSMLEASSATKTRHPALQRIGNLQVCSANTSRLNRSSGDGWLAVGDSAFSFDPLSSEGMTKALEWGGKAATCAKRYLCGEHNALATYHDLAEQTFAEYLVGRYRYYRLEQRWPTSRFWHRRHRPPELLN
ncbi:MAG: NAD(P)/FAD-dependent oxidoreductase [Pseudomonadota bacterium]